MKTTLSACIPSSNSSLYDTFGIDLFEVANCDGEIVIDHVEWIEEGDFPDPDAWKEAVDDLAWEHDLRILWGGEVYTGEYIEVPAERIEK